MYWRANQLQARSLLRFVDVGSVILEKDVQALEWLGGQVANFSVVP